MYSKKKQWIIFAAVNGLLAAGALLFPLYSQLAAAVPIGRCAFLQMTGLYCMGCGVTRSLQALWRWDIAASLLYNPMVLLSAVLFLLYEAALVVGLVRGTPRPSYIRPWMAFTYLGVWVGYALLRNLLLLAGIDLLTLV